MDATFESHDEEATARAARALAEQLRPGDALVLDGELGAGKTCFVRALSAALGGREAVSSPTFTLENRLPLEAPFTELVHVDLYRMDDEPDPSLLASVQEARDEGALVAVEWGDPWLADLAPCLRLAIEHAGRTRRLALSAHPEGWVRMPALIERWAGEASR